MDELVRIIEAVSEVYRRTGKQVLSSKDEVSTKARMALCCIVRNDKYGMIRMCADMLGLRQTEISGLEARYTQMLESGDIVTISQFNAIRNKLNLPRVYQAKEDEGRVMAAAAEERRRSHRNSKRLFGIEYTPKEELWMLNIKKLAYRNMQKICAEREYKPTRCF